MSRPGESVSEQRADQSQKARRLQLIDPRGRQADWGQSTRRGALLPSHPSPPAALIPSAPMSWSPDAPTPPVVYARVPPDRHCTSSSLPQFSPRRPSVGLAHAHLVAHRRARRLQAILTVHATCTALFWLFLVSQLKTLRPQDFRQQGHQDPEPCLQRLLSSSLVA